MGAIQRHKHPAPKRHFLFPLLLVYHTDTRLSRVASVTTRLAFGPCFKVPRAPFEPKTVPRTNTSEKLIFYIPTAESAPSLAPDVFHWILIFNMPVTCFFTPGYAASVRMPTNRFRGGQHMAKDDDLHSEGRTVR